MSQGLDRRIAAILLIAGFGGSFFWFYPTFSADLMAVWLAGHFDAVGRPDLIYPSDTDFFHMYPPDGWREYMDAVYDYDGPIYPFLYPPLWAKLAGLLSGVNFWVVTVFALVANAALQVLTIWLALRVVQPRRMPASLFVALGLLFLFGTHVGTIALQQNQPQILVSFLLVLAVERSALGANRAAGVALAFAAALKIYPAVFALFWLAARRYRAFAWFCGVGGVLGLLSLVWAGWPLHQAFLSQLRMISGSVLTAAISFNLDATLAANFFSDALQFVPAPEGPSENFANPGWYSMARPGWWQAASAALLIAVIALLARAVGRAREAERYQIIWPLGVTLVALLSPITWVYYYLPTVAFAPMVIERLGYLRGGAIWAVSFGLLFIPFRGIYHLTGNADLMPFRPYLTGGFVAFALIAAGMVWSLRVAKAEKRG